MNNIFSKLRDFVGLNEQVEYEYYEEEPDTGNYQNLYQEQNAQGAQQEAAAQNRRWREPMNTMGDVSATGSKPMSNVIGMPGAINGISEVLVLEPRTFEEMPQAIQALRERKSVVLNLTIMDPRNASAKAYFCLHQAACKLALSQEFFMKYLNPQCVPHVPQDQIQPGEMTVTGWHSKHKLMMSQKSRVQKY
jgi:FtsZ-interacting cell division protein YlmF